MIAAAVLGAQFVLIQANVSAYGVPGTATFVIDRRSGKFARRFNAGAASEQEGFDGTHAWRADATGVVRVQTNSGERAEILQWSRALRTALSSPAHIVHISGATDRITVRFENIQKTGALSIPQRITSQSAQNGVWIARTTSIVTTAKLAATAFAPPAAARDFSLSGITRIPISMSIQSPTLEVTVNGTRLNFLFDTGGQNVITTEAAKKIGLTVLGNAVVSGGGGGTAPIAFATVRSLRVGNALLVHQPFIVLPAASLPGVDGIVGYELLARLAARLDMEHGTLELARDASAFGKPQATIHFGYFDRQPQVDGSLDGLRGAFSIDTGSSLTAQVQTPAVRNGHLVDRLHASVIAYANDVGGKYPIYLVRAHALNLGSAVFPSPVVDLLVRESTSNNASIVANIGDGILRRWIIVFDYPHQKLQLRTGGDPNGTIIHDRSGIVLSAKDNTLIVAQVLHGTPAFEAGIAEGASIATVNGNAVTASDLQHVRELLRGQPGTSVRMQFADGSTRAFALRKYL